MQMLRKRPAGDEKGFTLIELMVVVMIIAILIAIAVPAFLGARNRANDRAAQSDVRNAVTAEKTFFADNQLYGNAANMTATENNQTFVAGAGTTAAVGIAANGTAPNFDSVCISKVSKTGTVMKMFVGTQVGTYYSSTTADTCPVTDVAPSTAGWKQTGF